MSDINTEVVENNAEKGQKNDAISFRNEKIQFLMDQSRSIWNRMSFKDEHTNFLLNKNKNLKTRMSFKDEHINFLLNKNKNLTDQLAVANSKIYEIDKNNIIKSSGASPEWEVTIGKLLDVYKGDIGSLKKDFPAFFTTKL